MVKASTEPIIQTLRESVLPDIRQASVSVGQRGGTREGLAEAQAVERAARAAQQTAANIYGNAYGQGLSATLSGLGMMPMMQESLFSPATWLGSVGEAQRGMEQARINEAIARHAHEQSLPWQTLSEYANLISGPMGGVSTTEVTGTPPDKVSQIFGGASVLIGLLPRIFDILRLFGIR